MAEAVSQNSLSREASAVLESRRRGIVKLPGLDEVMLGMTQAPVVPFLPCEAVGQNRCTTRVPPDDETA
jgi:hypothetical protein